MQFDCWRSPLLAGIFSGVLWSSGFKNFVFLLCLVYVLCCLGVFDSRRESVGITRRFSVFCGSQISAGNVKQRSLGYEEIGDLRFSSVIPRLAEEEV